MVGMEKRDDLCVTRFAYAFCHLLARRITAELKATLSEEFVRVAGEKS